MRAPRGMARSRVRMPPQTLLGLLRWPPPLRTRPPRSSSCDRRTSTHRSLRSVLTPHARAVHDLERAVTADVDYAHTARARANREQKASALAAACARLGVSSSGIAVGGGHRREVWRAAGLTRAPSEETWSVVAEILGPVPTEAPSEARSSASAPRSVRPSGSGPHRCRYGHDAPARLFMGGWLCAEHGPPPAPVPPPGSTLAERRARRGGWVGAPSSTVVDERAIASGKRRSTPTAFRAARAAQDARRAPTGGEQGE